MGDTSLAEIRKRYEQARLLGPSSLQDEAENLQTRDSAGRMWRIDIATGGWLLWDGAGWIPGDPDNPGAAAVGRPPVSGGMGPSAGAPPMQAPYAGAPAPMQGGPYAGAPAPMQAPHAGAPPMQAPYAGAPPIQGPYAGAPVQGGAYPVPGMAYGAAPGHVMATGRKPLKGPGCAQVAGWALSLFIAFCWFVYTSLMRTSEGWDLLTPLIIGGISPLLFFTRRFTDPAIALFAKARNVFPTALRMGAAMAVPLVLGLMLALLSSSGYGSMRLTVLAGALASWALLRNPEVTT